MNSLLLFLPQFTFFVHELKQLFSCLMYLRTQSLTGLLILNGFVLLPCTSVEN